MEEENETFILNTYFSFAQQLSGATTPGRWYCTLSVFDHSIEVHNFNQSIG